MRQSVSMEQREIKVSEKKSNNRPVENRKDEKGQGKV